MMKKHYSIFALALAALFVLSCEPLSFQKVTGDVDDADMWIVPDMAKGVLFQAYNAIPNRPDSYDGNFLDVATDNAVTNYQDAGVYRLAHGQFTSMNCPISVWSEAYTQFQNIHKFLENGLTEKTHYDEYSAASDAAVKDQLLGEAYYLRAWWGAYLLQHHGGRTLDGDALGYYIVTSFVSEEDASDLSKMVRNTYEECVEQICADCDSAFKHLPLTPTGDAYIGRATGLMSEFLKARVLFTAASPAYQPASIVRINAPGDFTVVDAAAYKAKWERAAAQAWKVIGLSGNTNFTACTKTDFVDGVSSPAHFVFRFYFKNAAMEGRHYPPFYWGKAYTTPSQNLVDAYPMKANGYPITDPAAAYDPATPYAGRDNRLETTIYHQGSIFGANASRIDVVYGGKDAESFMNGGSQGSRTGYYLHKFMSEAADLLNPTTSSTAVHFYPTMRMAEMFLDLAEASNEAWGPVTAGDGIAKSAYDIIKEIRQKAGGIVDDQYIETVKGSVDDFRKLILNERRLEFAFENVRFWDLRRTLQPLDETVRGMVVARDGAGVLTYSTRDVESRELNSLKYYYLPVPYSEIKKNPEGMINNMDY
ncbi:MAG: RagB/SusD family nutrient uptake outer membrane protein [Bacteroidales bacterium]|nr:RagB/SusD family nutrient uptake outer membrane protein [Bacteroidales bacterium]